MEVQTVPKVCPIDSLASKLFELSQQSLALRTMGARHSCPFSRATGNQRFVLVVVDYQVSRSRSVG